MFEKITAREFADRRDSGTNDSVLVDTRPEDSYEAWRIEGRRTFRSEQGKP